MCGVVQALTKELTVPDLRCRYLRNMESASRIHQAAACIRKKISASEAKPGDLFFYGSGSSIRHVGIYIGNGQIVHASNKRTGIKISNAYYRKPICVISVFKLKNCLQQYGFMLYIRLVWFNPYSVNGHSDLLLSISVIGRNILRRIIK